ncbi:MAG: hypothetical protein HC780_23935 [Leptolyngbyaceae cyanobacterium CSU_1_3]|nr:hypothetical protein [Leptolyngbyaceae cyanobacterium CSU_1_3]
MKQILWTAGLGTVLLLGSCGGDRTAQPPKPPAPIVAQPNPQLNTQQSFPNPTIASTKPLPTVAVKGLLQPTTSQARLSQISTATRRDPFASLLPPEIRVVTVNKPQTVNPRSTPAQTAPRPQTAQKSPQKSTNLADTSSYSAPQISLAPLTNLPPLPVESAPLTPSSLPKLLPASPTSLAEAIAITGVIQVGGKVTAIVQSPNESTARYVQVGDSLANGSVLLKRIIMNKSGEPTIVLQQNGVEVTKTVGSARVASL